MSRRLARLTQDTLLDLPPAVRSDLLWELDPVRRRALQDGSAEEVRGRAEAEKAAWVSQVLLEWGSCGRVAYVDDVPAGFVQYAPPVWFPGTSSFATAPVSEDAVQLATVVVFEGYAGAGLGRVLLQVMARDLVKRGGIKAVEAVASARAGDLAGDCGPVPAEFLERVGFRTARAHPSHPRMRLDLRTALSWREEVGTAWERLIGVVRPPAPAPAPVSRRPVVIPRESPDGPAAL
ncbi:GNAT family N-acetyltransferase [Nocardioides marmoribigeumensis]|jgi:GNAT superfamily N-acetyltransferase|uniref:GNAT superfamily N-acetyltransferase n=1 Tax=Nocardioides marmoribigeumensis TaxID=433649 RepID=A0ABU2BWD2_9ACTN|nr:GNAT family N-acetyltransferase [Nocardioides marmoribigeumensis]MDR7362324.1 GNAT superfamily N-acetyltransferase [Nocardioides marmoribigeumensis]